MGERKITVNCDATSWRKGSEIVITSTDYDRKQAETFFIIAGLVNLKNTGRSFSYLKMSFFLQ